MRNFVSVDFETANPQRVSACSFGYARVQDGVITECSSYLIKPVGGHAPFQSQIHGIKDEHTADKPDFGQLYPLIAPLFESPLVAHSLFDQQVLRALSEHFRIRMSFRYTDSSKLAKEKLPHLANHKLETLVKHFSVPDFRHHDAKADAIACAQIFLKLLDVQSAVARREDQGGLRELVGMINGILADGEVNYKEAYALLYWLDDHVDVASRVPRVRDVVRKALEDGRLDADEAKLLGECLASAEVELTGGRA